MTAAKTSQIDSQYSTGLSRHNIEQALIAAGMDLRQLQPADLGMLEDFHTSGRIATSQFAELAEIASNDEVLDAGSGIGGTARFLADRYGYRVTPSTSPRSTAKTPVGSIGWSAWTTGYPSIRET